jgi:mannosylglycoprotein endo-beta-mannosidase
MCPFRHILLALLAMRTSYLFLFLLFACKCTVAQTLSRPSSAQSFFLTSTEAHGGKFAWRMARVGDVRESGETISGSSAFDAGNSWQKAIVPGTVLTTLVHHGVYPDPYFGDNNRRSRKLIPDLSETGNDFYTYWYRTAFSIPKSFTGSRLWLKLHGINYRSEVWLNGKKLGNLDGMFVTKAFDVTGVASRKETNTLAIKVMPVDVPGSSTGPKLFKQSGAVGENSNGGNGEIGRNVTMLMSVGWDFTAPDGIRDRNTGIWRDVELYATGDVVLEHPFTWSSLPLPDTSSARQTISVEVVNATNNPQSGLLSGTIPGTGIRVEKRVSLAPNERRLVEFTPAEFSQLVIRNPKLWWPVNKGAQHLYSLELRFKSGRVITDAKTVKFGIREISSDQQTPDKSRRFLVNGVPVFIRGTNWIPEAMLKNSVERTRAELLYTRQAGLNLLRFWGGGIAESDYFFDLCDELGLMVWNEYWLTGDTRFPDDIPLYLSNVESTVKRIRNHAALAYHVSSNESTEVPEAAALIRRLDPSRGYQMQSECCGVHDGSPYKYENPMQYFENTASKRGSRVDGFNPEYGTLCLPTVESLRKTMPAKDLWPINKAVWAYLDGGGFHQVTTKYLEAVDRFGASSSIEEFARKAQFVGAMNYRAIWEVWNYNKFGYGDRWASGFLFWYHNSPVPQTSARMYDWSLEPTAALYYSRDGLEPLHPQFDYLKNTVSVYNDYRRPFNGYTVVAEVYDLAGKMVWNRNKRVDIPSDGLVKDALTVDFPPEISSVHFIKLRLLDGRGAEVADSFYWRSSDKYQGAWTMTGPAVSGFEAINQLPKVSLVTTAKLRKNNELEVLLENPSSSLSFFTQLKVQHPDGTSAGPAFYSDNFINLLPGESRKVTIRLMTNLTGRIKLVTDGFNALPRVHEFTLKPGKNPEK